MPGSSALQKRTATGAPERVILSSATGLNTPLDEWSGQCQCVGYDAITGYRYFFNSGGAGRSLNSVASGYASITLPTGTPLSGNRMKFLRAGPYLYLLTTTSTNGSTAPAIFRSDPTTIAWTNVFTLGAASDIIQTAFDTDGTYIYVGEYSSAAQGEASNNGPTNGTHIYRTAVSDGLTWTAVVTLATRSGGGVRHCHAVAADPYRPGHVYANFGDAGSSTKVKRSTDYGTTWADVVTAASFQAVQISFSRNWVWFAGDNVSLNGFAVWIMDRAQLLPRWATTTPVQAIPVPSSLPGRQITDASFTASSTTMTSATAAFTSADVGRFIWNNQQVVDGCYITAVTNSTTVVLSNTAANTLASQSVLIGGDAWYNGSYFGMVDPATERFYSVAMDSSSAGTVSGLFVLDKPGAPLRLLRRLHFLSAAPMLIFGGYIWFGMYRIPLPDGVPAVLPSP